MEFAFFPEKHIILQIGQINLYFYGAMYALSALFAYLITPYFAKKRGINISSQTLLDLIFWTLIGGVLGGRIFYALVYNFEKFASSPLEIFFVWQGGMSIHGGLIGGAIAFIVFCKTQKIPLGKMADSITPALALGLALGRLGNFMNEELPGRITDIPWGMDFADGENRHPSQLYAMGKDLILMAIVSYVLVRNFWSAQPGKVFTLFLGLYAIFRFTVEFFRAPDPQIGLYFQLISMGQILSIILLCSAVLLLFFRKKFFE